VIDDIFVPSEQSMEDRRHDPSGSWLCGVFESEIALLKIVHRPYGSYLASASKILQ
jgi:hypothetical protein